MIEAIWHILLKLSPWLLAGTVVAALLHVLLPTGFARRRFTGHSGVLRAVGFGVPLPLCSCGVVPAGIGLKQEGASAGAAMGFLISTPQTGVDSILVSASFLGWPFALLKVAAAAITGILGGWLVDGSTHHEDQVLQQLPSGSEGGGCCASENKLKVALTYSFTLLRSIWGWLVIGVLISATISVFLPPGRMTWVAESGVFASSLLALVISLPLYVCATASVPIAAALVNSGFPAGAALVFLMAGPATNVATMGAVYRHFGGRPLGIYLSTIIIGSLAFAVAFDTVIQPSIVTSSVSAHDHGAWWEATAAWMLSALLAYFAWDELWSRITLKKPEQDATAPKACGRCDG